MGSHQEGGNVQFGLGCGGGSSRSHHVRTPVAKFSISVSLEATRPVRPTAQKNPLTVPPECDGDVRAFER